jgi:hypothetical protein
MYDINVSKIKEFRSRKGFFGLEFDFWEEIDLLRSYEQW